LTVKFGESVPEQRGLYTQEGERGSRAMEWAPNAMVLTNQGHGKVDRLTIGARFFGFANAYKTDPAPEGAHAEPNTIVNVNNTTINETNIRETNVRVDETQIEQSMKVGR